MPELKNEAYILNGSFGINESKSGLDWGKNGEPRNELDKCQGIKPSRLVLLFIIFLDTKTD